MTSRDEHVPVIEQEHNMLLYHSKLYHHNWSSRWYIAVYSGLMSCTIDTEEQRDIATADIPGVFMQADMIGNVHVKLEGKIAKLLAEIDPKAFDKFIHMENGKKVMYLKLRKALYGTLQAALLFWQTLSEKLLKWGFEVNPYDWCVANKMIDGKQSTALWHVDDIKISHMDMNAVTQV